MEKVSISKIVFALLLLPLYSFAQSTTVQHECNEEGIEFVHNTLSLGYHAELTIKKSLSTISSKVQKEADSACKSSGYKKAFVFAIRDLETDIEDFHGTIIGKRTFRTDGSADYCCLSKKKVSDR